MTDHALPLLMAARVQLTVDRLTALKARTPTEVRTEARLRERLETIFAPLLERAAGSDARSEETARAALGSLEGVEEALLEVLSEEIGEEAARAIAAVERKVGATKQLPDALRPYNMDRRLFDTLSRVASRMLGRFQDRTVEALVQAAEVDMPRDQLREVLRERLGAELRNNSRHALGEARNEATETAERDLGVTHHRWVTAGDGDVRPAHADVDGEVVRVGEEFSNGWLRPGGVGCRCRLEPVVQE